MLRDEGRLSRPGFDAPGLWSLLRAWLRSGPRDRRLRPGLRHGRRGRAVAIDGGVFGNTPDHGTGRQVGARALADLEPAGGVRDELHGGLVRLDLEQRFVGPDDVAILPEPADDDGLAHRLAELGDPD